MIRNLLLVTGVLALGACSTVRPDDRDAARDLTRRGYACHQSGDLEGALAAYDAALARDPYSAVTWNNRACVRIRQRRLDLARQDVDRALELRGDDAHFHNNRGVVLQLSGDLSAAEDAYGEAIRLDGSQPNFWSNRGYVRRLRGRLRAAREDFDTAIELDDGYAKAYQQRAHVRAKLGDEAGAEEDFERYAGLVVDRDTPAATPASGTTLINR